MAKSHQQRQVHQTFKSQPQKSTSVARTVEMRPDGTSVMAISLDMLTTQIPERKYLPDIASVVSSANGIKLLFGQMKIVGGLRNLLLIDLSHHAVEVFLEGVDAVKEPSYEDIARIANLPKQSLTEIIEEPEQTVAFKANIISSVASGAEACLDFYYLSPFSVLKLQEGKDKVDIDPVVRVDLHTNLLIAIIDALRKP